MNPGDLVILTLKNDLKDFGSDPPPAAHHHMNAEAGKEAIHAAAT